MDESPTHVHRVKPKESELSETTENYLKRILWLSNAKGYAKVSEIAELMSRSLSSTTEAMKRLKDQGFINYEKYGKITLTAKGIQIAKSVEDAYLVIGNFLKLLGLDEEIAHEDACSMEHAINPVTVERIRQFLEYIEDDPVNKALMTKFVSDY